MANIMTIGNVRGYIAEDGNAWLNAEDVARGWGFVNALR
jgi:phage antirepressor protein